MGPVSFTTLPFTGSAASARRLATALTDAGIRVVSLEIGSGVLVRSDDIGRARAVLDSFDRTEPKDADLCSGDSQTGR